MPGSSVQETAAAEVLKTSSNPYLGPNTCLNFGFSFLLSF